MSYSDLLVGIGAPSGTEEFLIQLLRCLPSGFEAAVVVVHYNQRPGDLVEALRATGLPVHVVEGPTRVEAGHVYLGPPDRGLEWLEGMLVPGDSDHERVDQLFLSLAADENGARAGLLLPGGQMEGRMGLRALRQAGLAAYAHGDHSDLDEADLVTSPEEMVGVLNGLTRARAGPELAMRVENCLPEICDLLMETTGQDFRHYKRSTLVRRVLRRMHLGSTRAPEKYLEALRADPAERRKLSDDLLIGVTAFFRDREVFEALAERVLPVILAAPGPPRIWVPGCSTGEEAYSLAMLLAESRPGQPAQIFATDIDERSLQVARRGRYSESAAARVGAERLERFFLRDGRHFVIKNHIREMCVFSRHNLFTDPPFQRLQLISCRNVLIYLGSHLRHKLVPLFHYALMPGGFLVLGPSESLTTHEDLFEAFDLKLRIARRRTLDPSQERSVTSGRRSRSDELLPFLQRALLAEFTPRAALIDQEGALLCAAGDLSRYVAVGEGAFDGDLVRLARPGLKRALRSALLEAAETRRTVERRRVRFQGPDTEQSARIIVQPAPQMGQDESLYMVVFQEEVTHPVETPVAGPSDTLVEQLESELSRTRDNLEKVVFDLQSANQELTSSNEELISLNEELQTANEELATSREEVESAHQALARSKEQLENIVAGAQVATLFLDKTQRIQFFSPAVTEIYNLLPSDVGRPLWHQTHNAESMPALPTLEEVESAPCVDEVPLRSGRVLQRRVTPYRARDGSCGGIIVHFVDVSDLRESQHELLRARDAAEAANRAKSEFLANMSHEIRTPMTAVMGHCDILLRHLVDPDNLASAQAIKRNAEHLVQILNDILDLSRIEAGRMELVSSSFSPVQLACEVMSLIAVRAEERGVELVYRGLGQVPEGVDSDATRIRQILLNLLGNAIKFTPQGTVTLELGVEAGWLIFRVRDTGIGIAPENLETIFRPFDQADTSQARAFGGTGLGLAICRRLAELLGGRLTVESELGQGSTFSFALPTPDGPMVDAAAEVPAPTDARERPTDLTGYKLLVVDDRADVRTVVQTILEESGASVRTASDGYQALELVGCEPPFDALVLDMQMPGMDGYETARQLRETGYRGAVLALTASAMKGDRERCLEAGCDGYLSKPVDGPRLTRLVASLARRDVLVVDDNRMVLSTLTQMLKLEKRPVRTAQTADEARRLVLEKPPAVVILDLKLGPESGLELIKELRRLPGVEGARFIAHTGTAWAEKERECREAGFAAYLEKPASLDSLRQALEG